MVSNDGLRSSALMNMRGRRKRRKKRERGMERAIKVGTSSYLTARHFTSVLTSVTINLWENTTVVTGVRWRRSRMSSGGGPEEERGHRGRNTELRRSISDMNLSLRRRQGKGSNDPRRSGNPPNGQDRKNIVSMMATEGGEVKKTGQLCNISQPQ